MTTYKELIAQRAALEQAIAAARHEELAVAIAKAKSLVEDFGLTPEDVFPGKTSKAKKEDGRTSKVAAKYRDAVSGATWTGRGKPPLWIAGKDREQFLITA